MVDKIGHHAFYWDAKSIAESWSNTWGQLFVPEINFTHRENMPILLREVRYTFSGEVGNIVQGSPVLLIRTQGCNFQCPWCDTEGSKDFEHGLSVDHRVLAEMMYNSAFPILLTGGEPLLHTKAIIKAFDLLDSVYNVGRTVQIETNGSIAIDPELQGLATFVLDYKFKYEDQMKKENWKLLTSKDFIKILVTDQEDVLKLKPFIQDFPKDCKARLAISCTDVQLYKDVCDLVLDNKWPIIVNVQIHKILGIA